MSGGKGGSQTSQVEIPSWIQQPSIRNMARAESLQKVGYMPYMGPDVAGLTSPQQQAMQANIDAASAFGLVDPGMSATDGMPQTSQFGGVSGYSSYPMYEEAVDKFESAKPKQAAAYNNLFVKEQGNGYKPPGTMPGFASDGPDFSYNPLDYSVYNSNPYGVSAGDFDRAGPTGGPNYDTEDFITSAQLAEAMQNMQQPDMSDYVTANDFDNRFLNMPTYDDSQLRNDINSRFETFNPTVGMPDMSGYATTEQLNNRFEAFDPMSSMPDLSNYAQMSDLYDDSQLRTDMNSRFETFNPNVTMPDLSNYATTESVNNRFDNLPTYQAPDLSGYATNESVNNRFSNLSQYDDSALREDINNRFSNLPTYQTPDLSNYATTESVNNQFNNLPTYQAPDLSGYATNDQLNTAIAGVPQFDPSSIDLSGYATSQDLNSAISGLPTYQAPDLSNYAQMSDLYNDTQLRQDMNSRFSNLPTYQAPDLSNYATNDALSAGLQGINQYDDTQLRQDINNRFSNLPTYQAPDLSGYATTQSVNNRFNNLSQFDPSGLQGQINANQQAISNLPSYQAPDLGNYATKDQLIGLLSDIGTSSTGVNPSLYSDPNLGQNNVTSTPVKATTKKKVSTIKGAR
jgi:hypothetical protein